MDIVLDSNIIRQDFIMKDKNYEILGDYLKKTNSKLVLVQIVLEEVAGLYGRELAKRIDQYKKSVRKLSAVLIDYESNDIDEINIESAKRSYIKYLCNKHKMNEDKIVKYKNDYLPEITKRAIERKKPLGNKGQQFRDGLLWLTILDYAKEKEEKRLMFISNNSVDFSENGENALHSQLKQDCLEKGVEIVYFKSLADFVEEHVSRVEFVTREWLRENIDVSTMEKLFNEIIKTEEEAILSHIRELVDLRGWLTGYINDTAYIKSSILEYCVYEMMDGTVLINIEMEIEKEYEIEVDREVEVDMHEYGVRKYKDGIDYEYENPVFLCKYVLTIRDEKIVEYEFKEWDWG